MKWWILLLLPFLVLIYLFNFYHDEKLNRIEFADSFEEIQGSVIELNFLFKNANTKCKIGYYIDFKDTLIIGFNRGDKSVIGSLDSICPEGKISSDRLKK